MRYKKLIKAQAALEFLTTYGWAFLVILIMIGTLAYFGILSPGKILPNRCNFGAEFACVDYQIRTNAFKMRLKNNAGEPIDVTLITFQTESATPFACTSPTPPAPPSGLTGWNAGDVKELSWTGCSGGGIVAGEKGKIGVTIQYNKIGSTGYTKEIKGEVFSTVLPPSP